MKNHFERVKHYLQELNYDITYEDATDEIYIINDESNGIKNLIIDCEDSILMIEQFIFDVQKESLEMFKTLLVKNRQIVHGAFALDETGTKVLFRDTLQLENLDLNELEASINSLKLLLAEHIGELLTLAKQK
ncbi:MAG: molecular chaperone Tir [Bacteroidetes bacterium]|nr:MAG: molecular chaperone Tir [Bacteroidota bacterium]